MTKELSKILNKSDIIINKTSKELINILKKNNFKLITAESLTAGMIVSSLIDHPGTSKYIYGGIATYDIKSKKRSIIL